MIGKWKATFVFFVLLAVGPGDASTRSGPAAPAGASRAWWAEALASIRLDQEHGRKHLGLKKHPSWTSSGDDQAGATFGTIVAAAGDVNGDGFADVIVGAPNFSGAGLESGKAYVFFGSHHGLSTVPGWTATGSGQGFAQFGASVATAGDVNGDGFSDIIVGEPFFESSSGVVGKAYVFHGSPSGPSLAPDWTSTGDDQVGSEFGFSVSTAGDVNGDGFSDVVIGAPLFMNASQLHVGKATVFHGSASGLSTLPAWQQTGEAGSSGLSLFGQSVSTAGDVNGDGFSEIIVGAPFADGLDHINTGKAYVFGGGPCGLTLMPVWSSTGDDREDALFARSLACAGDVNDDGFDDVIIGAPLFGDGGKAYVYPGSCSGLSTVPDWTSVGDQTNADFGYGVAGAGDVNGDGFDDILVGAPLFSTSPPDQIPNQVGKAYAFLGSACGLEKAADWTSVGDAQSHAFFGSSVSTAGDVDGDGLSDVVIGAPFFNTQNGLAGKAYLYEGQRTPRHRHRPPHRRPCR